MSDVKVIVMCSDPEQRRRVRLVIRDAMREAGYPDGGPPPEVERPALRLVASVEGATA